MFTIDATNLPRLMACNGSRFMEGIQPAAIDIDTTVRDEGNAAHYMARMVFERQFNIEELVERKAPNGVYMTPEMSEHVAWYLEGISREYTMSDECEINTSFGTDNWRIDARADHIGWNGQAGVLYIDDFKYGWRSVSPEMNWTLIAHAIGFCIVSQIIPVQIIFNIHQPRPYHPDGKRRAWSCDYLQLMAMYDQIQRVMADGSHTLQTGEHCKRCPANATCPAARAANMNCIDMAEQFAFNDQVSNEQLSFNVDQFRRAIETLQNSLDASEELIKHRLRAGQVVDNFSIEPAYGNLKWKEGVTVETVMLLTGANVAAKPKMITPTQAKKLIPESVMESLSERPSNGTKLVRISADKRAKRLLGEKEDD